MTATVFCAEYVESDHDRHEIANTAFEDLSLEIFQHFATSQPDTSSKHYAVLQDIVKSAEKIFSAHNQSKVILVDAVTGILGHVDDKEQCLMHMLSNSLELEIPPFSLQRHFLDASRDSPESLLRLKTARELILQEFDTDIFDDTATAEFTDKYIAGQFESGCAELHWAAQRPQHFNTTWILVSRVNHHSCMAVTGIFINFESGQNNQI
jgi:hypothetical protein